MKTLHGHLQYRPDISSFLDINFWYQTDENDFYMTILSNDDYGIPTHASLVKRGDKWVMIGHFRKKLRKKILKMRDMVEHPWVNEIADKIVEKRNEMMWNYRLSA